MDAHKALHTLLDGHFENEDLELFVARIRGGIQLLDDLGEPGLLGPRYVTRMCSMLLERELVDDDFFRLLVAEHPGKAEEIDLAAGIVFEALGRGPRRTTQPGAKPPVRPAVAMERPRSVASTSASRVRAVSRPSTTVPRRAVPGSVRRTPGAASRSLGRAPSLLTPTDGAEYDDETPVGAALLFYGLAALAFLLHATSGLDRLATLLGRDLASGSPTVLGAASVSWLLGAVVLLALAGTVLLVFARGGEDAEFITTPARALGIGGAVYLLAAASYGLGLGSRVVTIAFVAGVAVIWLLTGPLNTSESASRTPFLPAGILLAAVLLPIALGAP